MFSGLGNRHHRAGVHKCIKHNKETKQMRQIINKKQQDRVKPSHINIYIICKCTKMPMKGKN